MSLSRSLLMVLLGFEIAMVSAQTTYYVSASGSDSNNGLSAATPFKTLAKAGTLSLGPGDQLLLERGSVWRGERLRLNSVNGSDANPATIGAYGVGDKPTIYGSVPLPTSGWNPVSGSPNVYSQTFAPTTNAMYAGDQFLKNVGFAGFVSSTPNSWAKEGSTVYINTGGRDIATLPTAAGVIDRNIWVRQSQNFVVEDIVVRDSANSAAGESFKVDESKNVTWRNLEAYNASQHHFEVIDTSNFLGENLKAVTAEPGRGGSAYVSYSGQASPTGHDDHVWRNISYEDTSRYMMFYTHGNKMGDLLIENAQSIGDTRIGIQTEGIDQHVVVRGGQVNAFDLFGNGILIDGVHVTGPNSLIMINGNNNVVQNLLAETTAFDNSKNSLFFIQGKDNVVRFNTLNMDPSVTGDRMGLYISPKGSAEFYGNVMTNFPTDIRADGSLLRSDFNAYDQGAFMLLFSTMNLASWNTFGFDKGSVVGPISFADPGIDDFRLSGGQPAQGLVPSGFTDYPLKDYSGIQRSLVGPIDPGAFAVVPEASTIILAGIGTAMALAAACRARRPS
ncbi:hypothetical protein K2X85_10375 [bacterium]|nr:hypothetical protein [bacterium]